MRRAWTFGIISLFVLVGCRMTNQPTEAPVRGELPVPVQEAPAKELPPVEKSPGIFSRNRLLEFTVPVGRALGKKGVELWYNTDGEVWGRGEFFEAGQKKAALFASRDGRYEVVFVPIDSTGSPEMIPSSGTTPDYIVTVDTRAPQVEVRCPNGGEAFSAGKPTLIKWHAVDPHMRPDGIQVEVKIHDGQWVTIDKNLPNTGSVPWDVPRFEGGRASGVQYKIRVTATDLAGNTGADESDKSFTVDGLAPTVHVVGPSVSSSSPVQVSYVVDDLGGSGVREIHLYFTRDGGATWLYYGSDDDGTSPMLFQELDGDYGFYATAVDHVGNRGAAPGTGTKPQQRTIVDSSSPRMKFISPKKQAYLAGRAMEVRWALRDNVGLAENPVRLDCSADGGKTWTLIREKVSKDSPFLWSPPKESGDQYMLKAIVHDLAGNETIVTSSVFAIDSALPEARVVGPARSNKSITNVEFEIINQGFSPLGKVVLWYSSDNGVHWHRWGEDPDLLSPMTFAKADGTYALYVTCESRVGARAERRQKPPVDGTRPDFTFDIEIDSTPPVLELKEFTSQMVYAAESVLPIRWSEGHPKELHPNKSGVNLFYSTNGGEKWESIIKGVDPEAGGYDWPLPAGMTEKSVLIRMEAEDSFGNRGSYETEIPFEVDGISPVVKGVFSVDDELRSLPKTVTVKYRSSDGQSGLKRVELWGKRKDGVSAELLKQNGAPRGTISVDISEKGTWSFWLIAEDMAGNRSLNLDLEPLALFERRIGFPEKVELALLSFAGGGKPYRGGASLLIALRSNIPLDDLRAKVSSDSGKTWKDIPDQNLEPVRGGLLWHNMPSKTGEHYRLMVYNRSHETSSSSDFSIDATAPRAAIVGPSTAEEKSAVILESKIVPSLSLIVGRTLWVTGDAGKKWSLYKIFRDPAAELVFISPKPGKYGFYLVATSRVGLSGVQPAPGTTPQHSVQMGPTKEVVQKDPDQKEVDPKDYSGSLSLTMNLASILRGGSSEILSWKGLSTDPKATVSLYLRCDGADMVIKEGLPVSGSWKWMVPSQSTYRCEIRACINVGSKPRWAKPSQGFSIDISPPRVLGSEIVEE